MNNMDTLTWEDLKEEGFKGFYPGGIVTSSEISGFFGEAIRIAESLGSGVPAERSHAMIYAGAGNVISQNWRICEQPLSAYKGALITSWHFPAYLPEDRARLVAEARQHIGRLYDFLGLIGQLGTMVTGAEVFREKIQIPWLTYCSEFVCSEMRRHLDATFMDYLSCQVNPDEMELWMRKHGWKSRTIKLIG